jgi:hypothetical protein
VRKAPRAGDEQAAIALGGVRGWTEFAGACYKGGSPDGRRVVRVGLVVAQVAQLVEQRTENPRVGGSNPPLGTTHNILNFKRFFLAGAIPTRFGVC